MDGKGGVNMLEQIFLKVVNMGITASCCIFIVLLLRILIRKLPKIYSYVLWAAVFFRLSCPVSLQSTLSLLQMNTEPIPHDIGMQQVPYIVTGQSAVDLAVNHAIKKTIPPTNPAMSIHPMQVFLAMAGVIWLVVGCLLIAYSIWSYMRLQMRLQDAVLLEEGIYEKEDIKTPFVAGLFRASIYLPSQMEEQEKQYVLEHEKTHIRRKDHLIKQVAFLICCVHWFHPLVWLSFYLMCRDMEMSCDECVIRKLGGDVRKTYSAALLSMSSGRKIVLGSPLAFGEGSIRSRIVNVLHYKKRAVWVSVVMVVVIAAVTIGLILNPKNDRADGGQKEETRPEAEGTIQKILNYEGYLDESPNDSKNIYRNLDLDMDGAKDRIYQHLEGDMVSFEIHFGNDDKLFLGEYEKSYVFPIVSSAKIGTGENTMILFVGRDIYGDVEKNTKFALYTKLGGNYEKIKLPSASDLEVTDRNRYLEVTPEKKVDEDYFWQNDTAYDARILFYQGESCVAFYQNVSEEGQTDTFYFVFVVCPSARPDKNPYDLELIYAGWQADLEKKGFTLKK